MDCLMALRLREVQLQSVTRASEINQQIPGLRRDAQAALDFVLSQPRLAVSPVVR